ncbi:hypothetical protein, partial [Burkholderia multivorans]|uniref:hypothetical protein n=1 Tax=Burkholderia multivorans TaxID=87883 RepID=UPI001C65F8D6
VLVVMAALLVAMCFLVTSFVGLIICVVAADIAINKYVLGLSPKTPEFRRGMLYDWNPVGVVSLLLSGGVSIAIYFGAFGSAV